MLRQVLGFLLVFMVTLLISHDRVFLFAILVVESGYSQVEEVDDDFVLGGRFGGPDINFYSGIFHPERNPLGLPAETLLKGNAILNSAAKDFFNSLRTEDQRHQLMLELTEDFNSEQMLLFRQHVRSKHYQLDVSRHYRELGGNGHSFYWLHPELDDLLNVQKHQKDRVLESCSNLIKLKEDVDSRLEAQFVDLFSQWQTRLEDVLLPRQQSLFREATGEAFAFDPSVQRMFRFAYSQKVNSVQMPLCLRRTETGSEVRGNITPLHLLLIGQQRLDGEMNFHAATHLFQTESLRKELKLTESQIGRIKQLEDTYVAEHPLPQQLSFGFRQRGVAFTPTDKADHDDQAEGVEGSSKIEADDDSVQASITELNRRLLAILDSKQRSRWRQIQNQLVLGFGWKEVPLTFPDWPSYLELSGEQTIDFESIHVEMETRFAQAQKAMIGELLTEQEKLYSLSADILTPQQKSKLVLLFGKFSGFPIIE